jgi:hypothetical protein
MLGDAVCKSGAVEKIGPAERFLDAGRRSSDIHADPSTRIGVLTAFGFDVGRHGYARVHCLAIRRLRGPAVS